MIERERAIEQCRDAIENAMDDYVGLFEVYDDMTDDMANSILTYMREVKDSIR